MSRASTHLTRPRGRDSYRDHLPPGRGKWGLGGSSAVLSL